MSEVMRLPRLDSEPRAAAVSVKQMQSIGAPPSYRSSQYTAEDDVSSARWSEHSSASSALGKRRASWTNLIESDQNLNRYEPNIYPKVAGSLNSLPSAQKICVFPAGTFSTSSKASDNFQQTRPVAVQHHYPLGYQPSFTETASITAGMSNAYPPRRQVAYTPSQQSVMSEFYHVGSVRKLNESIPPPGQGLDQLPPKKNKMESLRQFFAKPCSKLIFLFLILLVLAGIIVAIVLSQTLGSPKHFNFSWLAPHSLRQNDETPNRITMDIDGNQVKADLVGAMPFKGSYRSVLDFKTNKVAIMDSSLKKDGNYSICFLMPLDRRTIPDITALQKAGRNSESKNKQNQGWIETWNYVPQPLPDGQSNNLFSPQISECKNARWIQLNYVGVNQKAKKCTNCFDFCLPEYGIERDFAQSTETLNVIKRNCFYMFVPEWRNFAQDYSASQNQDQTLFGSLSGALNNVGQNIQQTGQDLQSKWISLQTVPQQISNTSQQLFGSAQNRFAGATNSNVNQQLTFNPHSLDQSRMQQQQMNPNGQTNNENRFQQPENHGQESVLGPPYHGQLNQNGQFHLFNQPSSLGQGPQNFAQQNDQTQTSPQNPSIRAQPQNLASSQLFNSAAPTQQQIQGADSSFMNGVNGNSNIRYTNQGQYGGSTNYQPQPMYPNTQPQQGDISNDRRPSPHPQVTQAQPQWINVG